MCWSGAGGRGDGAVEAPYGADVDRVAAAAGRGSTDWCIDNMILTSADPARGRAQELPLIRYRRMRLAGSAPTGQADRSKYRVHSRRLRASHTM